jgi:hypothetical protein
LFISEWYIYVLELSRANWSCRSHANGTAQGIETEKAETPLCRFAAIKKAEARGEA